MRKKFIKNSLKKTLRAVVSKYSRKLNLLRPPEPFVRVLMYHEVDEKPAHAFSVSTDSFDSQMKYLKENYQILSMDEVFAFLVGKIEINRNAVAVTFDDGQRCIYLNAYPVLRKYNIPASIFLVSDFLKMGQDTRFDKEFLRLSDVEEMRGNGITFGSHSKDHACLSQIPESHLRENIHASKNELEVILKDKVDYFAYPYGLRRHFNNKVKNFVKEAGYRCAFSAINGVNTTGSDLFALRRSKIERDDSFETFKNILAGGMDIWALID